jgi:predicted phage tail protein
MRDHGKGVMEGLIKRTGASITLLCLLALSLLIAGCGGGGGEGVSSSVVSGVAAVGAPLAGEARIKDSSNREKRTVIGNDGSFAFDVSDMTGPFILQARGNADGESHTLQSFADNTGIANINPLANAAVASAAEGDDPEEIFGKPDKEKLHKIKSGLPSALEKLLRKLRPLLRRYDADGDDPIRVKFRANHTRLDGMFDDVKIILFQGVLTITNKRTKAVIYTGNITDILNGSFNEGNCPNPGAVPDQPADVVAAGGDGRITLSWAAVGSAMSYNIYWSNTAGVTKTTGTRIAGAVSPYVQTGLATGAAYHYIVTAVNSAGEGAASAEVSATTTSAPAPDPTVPNAPTGATAAGGTKQATVSWAEVSGATSYNLYWSTTAGVTKATGTKIAGVTSPTVQNGLTDATTYYYIVTAVNSVGESVPSVQVAATTLAAVPSPTVPATPTGVTATGGDNRATISWTAVSGATSYNLYWSTTSGVTPATGTKIAGTTSPYVQTGLSAGTAYYYVVTAVNAVGESPASTEAPATTNAPAPSAPGAPTGVSATGGAKQVAISWSTVAGATSYNLYWSTASGVTTATGTKITGATSPYVQTGLADGAAYYYIVTAVSGAGEGVASSQVTAATDAAAPVAPAAPTGVTATGGANQVTITWSAVAGATLYNLYWSTSPGLTKATGTIIPGVTSGYLHTGLAAGAAYYYLVAAQNTAGEGAASAQVTATTNAAPPPPPPPIQTWALHTLYCAGCHGTGKRTSTVTATRSAISSDRGNMGMLGAANCTSCHGAGKAGQSALTDALIADILAGL